MRLVVTLLFVTNALSLLCRLSAAPQEYVQAETQGLKARTGSKDQSMRPVEFEDIITTEKPKLITISPAGTKVAFVVERSNIEGNKVTDTLYVWDKQSGSLASNKPLLALEKIEKILWSEDVIYLSGKKEKEFQIYRLENGTPTLLVSSSNPISAFTALNGHQLYYTKLIKSSKEAVKEEKQDGYTYRWGQDGFLTLPDKEYRHYEFEEVWCLDSSTGRKQFLISLDFNNFQDDPACPISHVIDALEISPDESKLAISTVQNRLNFQDLMVFEIKTNKTYHLFPENDTTKRNPCWINNNELVFIEANHTAFIENGFNLQLWNSLTHTTKRLDINIGDEQPTSLFWNKEKNLLIVSGSKGLLSVSFSNNKTEQIPIPENLLSKWCLDDDLSFDHHFDFAATIIEDSKTPPQVVLYDLKSETATTLTALNPGIKNIMLGKVEPMTITTEKGLETNGFLLYPIDYKPGQRYPLIIGTYGFRGRNYALNAEEWHSSFPAQMFAREGYFVFLLNPLTPPSDSPSEVDWRNLQVFEQAVTTLVDKQLVDADKVGLYGWSYGAFLTEYLISHSNKFQVASLGEGGDYDPSGTWMGGSYDTVKQTADVYGGPPWGDALPNYIDHSAFFNVDKIKTPFLMEYSTCPLLGLEIYTPLRYLNIPLLSVPQSDIVDLWLHDDSLWP